MCYVAPRMVPRYYATILSVRPALQRAVTSIDEDGRGRLAGEGHRWRSIHWFESFGEVVALVSPFPRQSMRGICYKILVPVAGKFAEWLKPRSTILLYLIGLFLPLLCGKYILYRGVSAVESPSCPCRGCQAIYPLVSLNVKSPRIPPILASTGIAPSVGVFPPVGFSASCPKKRRACMRHETRCSRDPCNFHEALSKG